MAIGGFSGSDPAPSLTEFKKLVSEHKIHYFVSSGAGGGVGRSSGELAGGTRGEAGESGGGPGGSQAGPGGGDGSQITAWVEAHFTAKTVGGTTVYDLTSPKASS